MRSKVNMDWMLMLLQWVPQHSPRILGPVQPHVVPCVRQSPTNAGPTVAHPMHTLHTRPPTSHTSRVREPSTLQYFVIVLGLLPLALPSLLDTSKCLCLAFARGRLGWAAAAAPSAAAPTCLF